MDRSPTSIFSRSDSIDSFREALRALDGDFFFDAAEMLSLGEAYFSRYPDSFSHRNSDEVLMGYEIARICIAEKALAGFDQQFRECFRSVVKNVSQITVRVGRCIDERGHERAFEEYASLMKNIDSIKFLIEGLPLGMVKERFIGGLAIFYNVSYIIKTAFAEYSTSRK